MGRALVACAMLVASCAPERTPGGDHSELMAAALHELVTVDHTFGEGPPPFSEYLVQSSLDPLAGSPTDEAMTTRPLTGEEKASITDILAPLGPVRFIGDPDDWRNENLTPTVEGAVILGVGEPELTGTQALVPVSLWCGGTCGTWLTYRMALIEGDWEVVGTEGPRAIS